MNASFSRAPHIEGAPAPAHPHQAPNAALLVDFDNVTMGMRSDLSKELKTLLNSDIIRGKVTVQRAYADWRRYPQYIVPLSEASIDLIFAPAYGSSKKNATDIRMAIDGMELVFTRPEIGTYILLTGDSDFSSLVLKLKEYGKYVIGVGIQESSSDILVQNCDEYYSYTSLSGLRKSDEAGVSASDPWVLVEKAVEKMDRRSDVMRSDRLKQVMLEMDSGFDEKSLGFNKFSRFLSEAAKKGLLQLRKMDNGQYEIVAGKGAAKPERKTGGGREGRTSEKGRDRGRGNGGRTERTPARESARESDGGPAKQVEAPDGARLAPAYELLRRAISDLVEDQDSDSVRDSDVKRRMLALEGGFDEAELGFPKFSRFLKQAHDHEIVDLRKEDGGNYQVALGKRAAPPQSDTAQSDAAKSDTAKTDAAKTDTVQTGAAPNRPKEVPAPRKPEVPASRTESGAAPDTPAPKSGAGRLRPRQVPVRGAGRKSADEPPPLFEGQVVSRSSGAASTGPAATDTSDAGRGEEVGGEVLSASTLRLPSGRDSIVQYLSNSYGGVGKKTAETLADALGDEIWVILQRDPSRVEALLPPSRAESVLEGWRADSQRRRERHGSEAVEGATAGTEAATEPSATDGPASQGDAADASPPSRRRGRRTRGGRRSGN